MKISVILTSYNHEKFLTQSIESVLKQTYNEFEFIIVDDCSSDLSWDIICEYKRNYPEIKTIRHEHNWGGGITQATVREYAKGDYIALHHSDDIWEPNKLQMQIEIMQANPHCVAVFTNAQAINDDGSLYDDDEGFYYNLFSVENRSRHEWLRHFFYHGNCLCHPSILIKKSVYEEDGFFRKGLKQIPDFVKWIQVCKKHEIFVLPDRLVKFRVHNEGRNTSGMRAETQIRSATELFLMLKEYETIRDREEFLKIFPEAEKYCTEDFFSAEYALGRICTSEGMPSYTRLFGVQLLYKTLNIPQVSDALQRNFNYTRKEFQKENGKYDIFGILPKAFDQRRSLYYDSGAGYNADEVISEKFSLADSDTFHVSYTICLDGETTLKGLRFDPVEGVMIKSTISEILINGIKTECVGENVFCQNDSLDIFLTMDPIYSINIPHNITDLHTVEIDISGKIERLTDDEIMQYVISKQHAYKALQECYNNLESNHNDLQGYCDSLKGDYNNLESSYNDLQGYYNKLQECYNLCDTELTEIKSTFLYKFAHRLKILLKMN